MAVIYGTNSADKKNGTEANDTIYGWAQGGNAFSPSGNDTLNGLAGNDQLFGGTGNDSLNGGAGFDTLNGGSGSDKLNGVGGNDTYVIDSTTDQVTEAANSGADTVQSSISFTLGSNLESLTLTGSGALKGTGNSLKNKITGNAANNNLNGEAGGDTLDGGLGIDTLIGGTGSDTYIVDSTTDTIIEEVNGNDFDEAGYTIPDVVVSSVSYILGDNLERLLLTGSSPINGAGNALENSIEGNNANNSLYGGADNDRLNGGLGSDTLYGETGDDTYVVDSTTDTIIEVLNAGVDTVKSSFSYKLAANVENLTLTGTSAINGTANALENSIEGNDVNNFLYGDDGNDNLIGGHGNDSLDGGAGNDYLLGGYESSDFGYDTVLGEAGDDTLFGGLSHQDTLIGGTGNDRYIIENTLDTITEDLDAGVDTVELNSYSSLSYTLSEHLENLTLTGEGDAIVIGNTLDNFIYGRSSFRGDGNITLDGGLGNDNLVGGIDDDSLDGGTGNDTLDGSPGTDTLTGGADADTFHFYSPLEGIDTITDFSVIDDTISVYDYEFEDGLTVGAVITTDQFLIGSAAADANDRFIYNNNTGALFFDVDGTGATEQVQLAMLPTSLAMTNDDIFVIG